MIHRMRSRASAVAASSPAAVDFSISVWKRSRAALATVAAFILSGIIAAAVFHSLERDHEIASLVSRANLLVELQSSLPSGVFERFRTEFGVEEDFEALLEAVSTGSLDKISLNWDMLGSFFFAFTVATTGRPTRLELLSQRCYVA